MSFNKVILCGNICTEVEPKLTQNGTTVVRFRIAVTKKFSKPNEPNNADFFDLVAWRQTAEFICRFFSKGMPILVSGRLENYSYKASDGSQRQSTRVVIDEATFVSHTKKSDSAPPEQITYGDLSDMEELCDDEALPF